MKTWIKLIAGGIIFGFVFFVAKKVYKTHEKNLIKTDQIIIINQQVDLGIFPKSKKNIVDFKIVNLNENPLTITRVLPDCDCTVAFANKKQLVYKDTLHVMASYKNFPGPFQRSVHVYFKGVENPIELFFQGKVLNDN
jgi:hypothetical protein